MRLRRRQNTPRRSSLVIATFSVIDNDPKTEINELNAFRQNEINNKHLLFRAHEHGLTTAREVQQFRPSYNFLPFGYRVCPDEKQLLQRECLSCLTQIFGFEMDGTPESRDLRYCRNIRTALKVLAESSVGDEVEPFVSIAPVTIGLEKRQAKVRLKLRWDNSPETCQALLEHIVSEHLPGQPA